MENFFKFFATNYVGIIYFFMSLVVVILFIQWIAWLFSLGRFNAQIASPRKRSDSIRFLLTDLMVKIINDFRHFLALIMVAIFGLVLIYSLTKYANSSEELTNVLQAVISTVGVLIGTIIGYYFGETAGKKSSGDIATSENEDTVLPDDSEIKPVEIPDSKTED